MELVGVWAHRETAAEVIGTDSGLLDSDEPNGVIITGDEEEIFALKPDCAVMVINIRDPRAAAAVNGEWYAKFLSRGINVVSTSVADLMWPQKAAMKELCDQLDAIGKANNASIFVNGQEPGYAENQAMLLASCSNFGTDINVGTKITVLSVFDTFALTQRETQQLTTSSL